MLGRAIYQAMRNHDGSSNATNATDAVRAESGASTCFSLVPSRVVEPLWFMPMD